jgi:hypothetical protein
MVALNEKIYHDETTTRRSPRASATSVVQESVNIVVPLCRSSEKQYSREITYNAMEYRITESYPPGGSSIPAGAINYIYYDSQWQAIETRTNGTAVSNVSSQKVWSAAYTDAAILQDMYGRGVTSRWVKPAGSHFPRLLS